MRRDIEDKAKISRGKYCNKVTNWLDILYCVALIFLLIHLFMIQIFDFKKYRERGKMQRSSHDFAVRGDIYDRHGIKLATDRIYYNIYARPVDYSKTETPRKIAQLFSPVLGIPEATLYAKLSNTKIPVIALKKDVDRDTAKKLSKIIAEKKIILYSI